MTGARILAALALVAGLVASPAAAADRLLRVVFAPASERIWLPPVAEALGQRLARIGLEAELRIEAGRIIADLPAGTALDAELTAYLGRPGGAAIHLVAERADCPGAMPGLVCLDRIDGAPAMAVEPVPRIHGEEITAAVPAVDPFSGLESVRITLAEPAALRFCRLTGAMVGRQIAVVVEGAIAAAPVITAPVCNGQVTVQGRFDRAEARTLADGLAIAAYPAPLLVVSHEIVERPPLMERLGSWRDYLPEAPAAGGGAAPAPGQDDAVPPGDDGAVDAPADDDAVAPAADDSAPAGVDEMPPAATDDDPATAPASGDDEAPAAGDDADPAPDTRAPAASGGKSAD